MSEDAFDPSLQLVEDEVTHPDLAAAMWTNPGEIAGNSKDDDDNGDAPDLTLLLLLLLLQVTHPDLAAAMWTNPREVAGNRRDDDGNGYVDDANGFDFVSRDGRGRQQRPGRAGVCQSGLKMISAKFIGRRGGSLSDAVLALNYLLDLKTRYNLNLVATSNSWGSGGYAQSFNAISAHNTAGILFVAAAGNDARNTELSISYPAGYDLPNIISVGSITSTGAISSFSNVGAISVDLFAPGSSILSTWPVNSYASISGTSMATPHVTGAVALYAAAHRQLRGSWPTAAQIKAAVMDMGVYDAAYDQSVSKKRLNVGLLINSLR
uniref:Peptidase S8/S53 domain-containing protein n=1 Tax=Tetradesmus obliquus TaxID=3088 RepID=A0A383VUZ6_TETOB|eukprot:jgi/Sobl393_1/14934/SZX68594.1